MDIKFGKAQSIEELIEYRKVVRIAKDYKMADAIRSFLDDQLVFVFDQKDGFQDVYYLTESYFKRKEKRVETLAMSNRQYVEFIIKEDIKNNKVFDAWLFSTLSNKEK